MASLLDVLGNVMTYINDGLGNLIFPDVKLPHQVSYKVHVHDDQKRAIETKVFYTLPDAMSWVQDTELMYSTEKKVFLEYVKEDSNSLIELNIYTNNVYQKRPTVYRVKAEN